MDQLLLHLLIHINNASSGDITVKTEEKGYTFILYSAAGYIGTADTSIEAIKLLDKYIESNEEKYRNLFDSLTT